MYKSINHSKYSLKVHIIFLTKYRRKILSNQSLVDSLKKKILQLSFDGNFKVEEMETDLDHIHFLIDYEPKVSILQIVRKLKQETTVHLWKYYSKYLSKIYWREHTIWADGYFACSIGEGASYETVREYIQNQG